MASAYTLVIKQGSRFEQPLIYCNPMTGTTDEPDLDNPIDISDYEARMQIRRRQGDVPILDLTTEVDGGLEIDGPAGTVTVVLGAEATAALTFSSAVYDVELVPPDEEPFRLLSGRVVLSREVTVPVP